MSRRKSLNGTGIRRKTIDDYLLMATGRNYTWLETSAPLSTTIKTRWRCSKGHEFLSSFANLRGERGCPTCGKASKAGKMRNSEEMYLALGKELGYTWLEDKAINVKTPTSWRCSIGHTWGASYNALKQGTRCPPCSRESASAILRLSEVDYHKAATDKGYKWLGPAVKSALEKTNWECANGHNIFLSINWITQQGCKVCSATNNSREGAIEVTQLEELAQKFNFKFIGPPVSTRGEVTGWRCAAGHQWQASAISLSMKWGCPECGSTRQEKKRARLTNDDYSELASKRGCIWLGPSVKNNQEKTTWKCAWGHSWGASYAKVSMGRGCPTCATKEHSERRRHTEGDYIALAGEAGIKWLGKELPLNNRTHTRWGCSGGHEWQATFGKIKAGRSCPDCSKAQVASELRLEPIDYERLAQKRGFSWWGPEADNVKELTQWECKLGHSWLVSYSNVLRGRGCPVCGRESSSEKIRLKVEDYRNLAAQRGLEWLGPEVGNSSSKTRWKCEKGDIFESAYSWIQGGNGCANCADMVKGKRVSKVQRDVAELLKGELNFQVGKYHIDVYLDYESIKVAVEYDSWYYHADRQDKDEVKIQNLIDLGWKVLQIKSNYLCPTSEQLNDALEKLIKRNTHRTTIQLPDWGIGASFADRGAKKLIASI